MIYRMHECVVCFPTFLMVKFMEGFNGIWWIFLTLHICCCKADILKYFSGVSQRKNWYFKVCEKKTKSNKKMVYFNIFAENI